MVSEPEPQQVGITFLSSSISLIKFHIPRSQFPASPTLLVKLDGANYFIYDNQKKSILTTTDLINYVEGSTQTPSKTLINYGWPPINQDYTTWRKQDRFVTCNFL